MTTTTQAIHRYGERQFLNVGACPYGRPECEGVSGLFMGELSCWDCWRDASPNAQETCAEVGV